ncbi:putative pre-16S rRNA nuclease [Helicobacter cinaedi]|uniref:Holliday junction resolvase RuvX n=1 Tax=Helicobacter cinaedi TaxID=213 RepID=UPI001F422A86|nr:Holliday junction resolvase RuvX [Helicobacter cinaedi]BDB65602.1 putative pre-16S rRNA nuclease [Helicobacter cinaedi]
MENKKILACDVGLKRIGLAVYTQGIVLPLEPIIRKNRNQASSELSEILKTREIEILVVGLPSGGVAEHSDTRKRILHFVGLVAFSGEIAYIDEDYTSLEALQSSAYMGVQNRLKIQKDGRLDSLSAAVILQRFLESKNPL